MKMKIGKTVLLLLLLVGTMGAYRPAHIRKSICGGKYYPATLEALQKDISRRIAAARVPSRGRKVIGIIVPDSSYDRSGNVAAKAFSLLRPGDYDQVIVLTPSHVARFRGCSIAGVDCYTTPLGPIPMNKPVIIRLCRLPEISTRGLNYNPEVYRKGGRVAIHEWEYGIELVLPFLQVQIKNFSLVPIVVGADLLDREYRLSPGDIADITRGLREAWTPRTLFVVSANLARRHTWGEPQDELWTTWDMNALDMIVDRATGDFFDHCAQGDEEQSERPDEPIAPGALPIALMLDALPDSARGAVLDYQVTHKEIPSTAGGGTVYYAHAAIAFFDLNQVLPGVSPDLLPPENDIQEATPPESHPLPDTGTGEDAQIPGQPETPLPGE